jgi:SAM-dependent methyltransferase
MSSVIEHYANHLAPVYAWMAGGIESAIERGAAEVRALQLSAPAGALAVDLGAGFGMHAIPLARSGYSVMAIDTCAALLDDLRARKGDLPIRVVADDLLEFGRHVHERPQAVLCMGDTLTHLDSNATVLRLISEVTSALDTGGIFVVTFRDYSTTLTGTQRFIPVRSDNDRILTCFLEYTDSHVMVHDVLHERAGQNWKMQISSYQKLRLAPDWLVLNLKLLGFAVRREPGVSGMVRIVGKRS